MKHRLFTPILAAVLSAGSVLNAQFSTDFSAAEGYESGDLSAHKDWAASPDSFIVNATESGSVLVQPTELWRQARYKGAGSKFVSNHLSARLLFTVNYSADSSKADSRPVVLPMVIFGNSAERKEYIGSGLRLTDSNSGVFNLFILDRVAGGNNPQGSQRIGPEVLGFSPSESGSWGDGSSDLLELIFTIRHVDGIWQQNATLNNTVTGKEVLAISQNTEVNDSAFADAVLELRISADRMSESSASVTLHRVEVKAPDA